MHYEDTREQYSKVVRGWNERYDLDQFIRAHGLQPLVYEIRTYKIDLDRKVAELRATGQSVLGH